MPVDIIKKLTRRYEVLFFLLALFFITILVINKTDAGLFANIIATLLLLAIIPFAILFMIREKIKKDKR